MKKSEKLSTEINCIAEMVRVMTVVHDTDDLAPNTIRNVFHGITLYLERIGKDVLELG